jgi:hypothetical protein
MTCTPINLGGGVVGIVCTRGRRAPPCTTCGRPSGLLCDGPPRPRSRKKTCDKPICATHATKVGEDRDLCPDCAGDAARAGAPPLTTTVEVWTARIDRRAADPDFLDITRKSGKPGEGLAFAPSEAILWPVIRARRRADEAAQAGMFHDALNIELDAWNTYVPAYLAEMLVSSCRPIPNGWQIAVSNALARGVKLDPEAWTRLLARPRVVLGCYCQDARQHCHRFLLAKILGKLGATLNGELPLPPSSQLSLMGEAPRG